MGRFKLFLPLVAFAILGVFLFRGLALDPTVLPSALVNQPVPTFALSALHSDDTLTEESLRGKPSLLNIWATWCYSCRVEHPYLLELAAAGITVVGLNYKDDATAAKQWLVDLGNPYTLTISDPEGTLGLDLGVYGAPETYVIDANGVVRHRHVGVLTEAVWVRDLAVFFEQPDSRSLTASATQGSL